MRTHIATRGLIWMSLAATLLLWPAEALAQQRRGGDGRAVRRSPGVSGRVNRPVHYYRPIYYRHRPYYSSFYWGAYGWYPYYPYWFGPYGYPYHYPYYYRAWHDDLGALRLEVKPREAQVYVDGYFAGLVDDFDGISQRLRAKPGEHEIELYLEGHKSFKEKMLFRPGQTLRVKLRMEPLGPGETPPTKPQPVGPPPTASRPADRYGRQAPSSGAELEPVPAVPEDDPTPSAPAASRASFGTLSIRVQPGDAVVTIDGERWEGGDMRDRLVIELSEGTHRLEVQKDGFTTYATDVRVRRGQTTTLNVSLLSSREM